MGRMLRIAIACGFVFVVGFVMSIGVSRPANAQGGIVCDFGPKKYKDCCRQSYREHHKLSARKRADDIDACMDAKSAKKKPAKDMKEEAPKDKAKDSSKEDSKKEGAKDEPTKPVEEKKKE
jgi:hypothetical protein